MHIAETLDLTLSKCKTHNINCYIEMWNREIKCSAMCDSVCGTLWKRSLSLDRSTHVN